MAADRLTTPSSSTKATRRSSAASRGRRKPREPNAAKVHRLKRSARVGVEEKYQIAGTLRHALGPV